VSDSCIIDYINGCNSAVLQLLKEKLWHEIDSLPDSRLKTLPEFVQFLQLVEDRESVLQQSSRITGLDADTTWISDDFDEPLPDSFWLGNTENHESATGHPRLHLVAQQAITTARRSAYCMSGCK